MITASKIDSSKKITQLYTLTLTYLSAKMGHSFSGLSNDQMRQYMTSRHIEEQHIKLTINLLTQISESAYAPINITEKNIKQMIQIVKDKLSQMEQFL